MGGTLQEDLLSISQAARLLGVQPLTLRRWDSSGVLVADFRTLGGCRRYSRKRLAIREKFQSQRSEKPEWTIR